MPGYLVFRWIYVVLLGFKWFYVDFMDSRGRRFVNLWRPVAACGSLWRPVATDWLPYTNLYSILAGWRPECPATCGGLWRPVAAELDPLLETFQAGRRAGRQAGRREEGAGGCWEEGGGRRGQEVGGRREEGGGRDGGGWGWKNL